MKEYFILCLLTLLFYSTSFFAQDSTSVAPINPSEGLNKGFYAFSVGVNFGEFTSKNEDAFFYYTLDEKNIKYNIKVGFSHNIKDNIALGVGFKFINDDTSIIYENTVGDTINTNSRERRYVTNIFYGISKSLFDSKRVFLISDPSLFFTAGNKNSSRVIDEISEQSESQLKSISLGLHVGLQVFLAPKLSAQFKVGPIGLGYQWEEFEVDGVPNGKTESFFARMSPDILSFNFSMSTYF